MSNTLKEASLIVDIEGLELLPEDREILQHPLVGGVILFARNYETPSQVSELTQAIGRLSDKRLLITVDQEGGRVQRFSAPFTKLPSSATIKSFFELNGDKGRELAEATGWLIGAEMRSVGVDLSFTPVLDLDYQLSEVIGDRSFGADPETVAVLAESLKKGLEAWGLPLVGKHFPGHGYVTADSHVALPVDKRPFSEIEARDLKPFAELVRMGMSAVMSAHVVYEQVDRLPATFSAKWLEEVLRRRLGFGGLVFSDDLTMKATADWGDICERVRLAERAGCDVLLICNDRPAVEKVLDELSPVRQDQPLFQTIQSRLVPGLSWEELQQDALYIKRRQLIESLSESKGV